MRSSKNLTIDVQAVNLDKKEHKTNIFDYSALTPEETNSKSQPPSATPQWSYAKQQGSKELSQIRQNNSFGKTLKF